jgi:uncharacterized BrkB/YihY/UPF0761 family membrane protein
MQKPYRRAFGLYLVINVLLVFSITLPITAIISHFRRSDYLDDTLRLWAMLSVAHFIITLVFIPSIASWLARKDAEREAKRVQQIKKELPK